MVRVCVDVPPPLRARLRCGVHTVGLAVNVSIVGRRYLCKALVSSALSFPSPRLPLPPCSVGAAAVAFSGGVHCADARCRWVPTHCRSATIPSGSRPHGVGIAMSVFWLDSTGAVVVRTGRNAASLLRGIGEDLASVGPLGLAGVSGTPVSLDVRDSRVRCPFEPMRAHTCEWMHAWICFRLLLQLWPIVHYSLGRLVAVVVAGGPSLWSFHVVVCVLRRF